MINMSRRQLARYAVEQIESGKTLEAVASRLVAAMSAAGKSKDYKLLISDIEQEFEERGLIANAKITSAHPFSESFKKQLANEIKKITHVKDVTIDQEVDKDVLGGFKIETANHAWDKTTAKLINTIKETV